MFMFDNMVLDMARRSDHTRDELKKLILEKSSELIRIGGVEAISSRKIAKSIGYTVGTIFQVFGTMDRLVATINMQTLEALFERGFGEPV